MPLIYLCHYKKNIARYDYLIKKYNNFHFVKNFDKEEIQEYADLAIDEKSTAYRNKILQKVLPTLLFNAELISAGREKKYILPSVGYKNISEMLELDNRYLNYFTGESLKLAEISLFLKHISCLKQFSQSNHQWGVIVEDDIIFKEDSIPRLMDLLAELPEEFDYIDIGGGVELDPQYAFNKVPGLTTNLYQILPGSTRTLCAYIVSKKFATAVVAYGDFPVTKIDFYLTYLIQTLDLKCYWLEDPIFIHGSENGYYSSSIQKKELKNLVVILIDEDNYTLNWENFKKNVLSSLNADLAVLLIKSSTAIRESKYWANAKFKFDISDVDQPLENEIKLHSDQEKEKNPKQDTLIRDILLKRLEDAKLDKIYDNFIFTSPRYYWVGPHPPLQFLKTDEFWVHAPQEKINNQHVVIRDEDLRDYLLTSKSSIKKKINPFPCIMYLLQKIDTDNFSNQKKIAKINLPVAQNLCEFYTAMSNYSVINSENSWHSMFENIYSKGGFSPSFLLMDRHFQTLDDGLNINFNNKLNYDDPECSMLLSIQKTSHLMLKFIDNKAIFFDSMDDSQKAIFLIENFNTLTNTDTWNLVGKSAKTLGLNSDGYFTKNVEEIVSPPLIVDLLTITPII